MRTPCLAVLLAVLAAPGCKRPAAPAVVEVVEPATDASRLPMKCDGCNVVFVSFDALQAAHVGALGYSRDVTPSIDAVAKHSLRFTRAYSAASWTVPASMTWFTGVYPSEHRMTNKFALYAPPVRKVANLRDLSPGLVTLAELLKQSGYRTAGFTGNAGVSGGFGYEAGFDVYQHEQNVFGGFDYSIPRALAWLRANQGHKFFLFLHGYDAHGQSSPEGGYDYRFVDRKYDKRFTGSAQEQEALREEGLEKGRLTLRDSDVEFWRAVYDEKIRRADDKFGQFLKEFDTLGLTGKTLFVLTSDHGTELYEHRRFDHGFTLYNELLHVPLFLRLPGQRTGKAISDRIGSIDVMPTILDLLNLELPTAVKKQLRGVSLVGAMKGEPVGRDVFSETDYRQYTYKRSVITPEGWKLIYTLEAKTAELYNLNDDPGETTNLADAEPRRLEQLERKLFSHFTAIGHDLNAKRWEIGLNPVYNSQAKEVPKN